MQFDQQAASYASLQQLNETMHDLAVERTVEGLMTVMLDRAMRLVGAERGWVSQLDMATGELQIVAQRGDPPSKQAISIGQGITGRALTLGKPQRAGDVRLWVAALDFGFDADFERAVLALLPRRSAPPPLTRR